MKKRKNPKIKEDLVFIPSILSIHLSDESNNLISKINESISIDEQFSLIKSISVLNNVEKYKILLMIYLICPYKHPAKKTIARILPIKDKEMLNEQFDIDLQNYLKAIIENDHDLKYLRYAINTCFDHFPAGIEAVTNILENILQKIPGHLIHLNSKISESLTVDKKTIGEEIHDYSRAIICIISLCATLNIQLSKLIEDTAHKLIVDLALMIQNQFISMDTKCNFGMIIIQCSKLLDNNSEHGVGEGTLKEIIYKVLRIKLNTINGELMPKMKLTTESERICIIIGILNTLTSVELYQVINNCESLIISLGKYLFEIADTSCALLNTNELLIVCRGIVLISKKTYKLMEQKQEYLTFLQMFIKFVLIHLEHYCDTIRHNSKVIMINLVKNAVQLQQNDDFSILNELIKSLFNSSANNEFGLYSCLSILCTEAGCNVLFKYDENLAQKIMSDVHLDSPYSHQIRTTYINLMTKHSSEVEIDIWKKLWIEPLINKIINENIHDDENLSLFQEAISIRPKFSIEIIDTYKNSCTNPALFLICAKIARKFGISNDNLTTVKWKGILDTDLLEDAFSHNSPTIRLSAIAIIADSRKTTEIFTLIDFKLIKSFLKINLNCTDASVRQDILAYYKKIWTRFKDSYLMIKRKLNDLQGKLSMVNTNDEKNNTDITKTINNLQLERDNNLQLIEMYEHFINEIRDLLLKDNLNIGVNYYRRNTTLEMYTLLKSILDGTDEISQNNVNNESNSIQIQTINLIACLYDGYEQNKKLALNILISSKIPLECILLNFSITMDEMIDVCMKLATSKKPADCITAAYLIHLILNYPESICNILKSRTNSDIDCPYYLAIRLFIIQLQKDILVAKQNIVIAAGTAPLYGCIFIIRYLHQQIMNKNLNLDELWINILKEVIDICFEISDLVLPIVNSQSPEGYFPETEASTLSELNNCTLNVTPQMVLLCAWRSVKEISLLYGDIVFYSTIINENTRRTGCITEDQVIQIGNYFISVLATTKHRGAFEQSYVGFTKLCKRLWSEKSSKLANLPKSWIEELLVDITNTKETNVNKKLCATRRSAGLPFMIQALEATALEVIGSVDIFKNCMETLLEICDTYRESEVNYEACTHAMNILRALFRHNQLGEHCIQFISKGVIVSLRAIGTNNWALHNGGTLLFSTLMTRIFGVQRNKNNEKLSSHNRMTIHVFFSRFPHLFDFLKEELRIASLSDNTLKLSLYPILLLLARLYPSGFEESQIQSYQISSLLPYLNECCKNRIYKTRELAAKAIIPLLDQSNLNRYFIKLLNEIILSNEITTNYCHGILLQMLYLLKSIPADDSQLRNIWNEILKIEWILLSDCYIIKDIYNKIIVELLSKSRINSHNMNNDIKEFLYRAQNILNMPSTSCLLKDNNEIGVDCYQLSNIKLLLHLQSLQFNNESTFIKILTLGLSFEQNNEVISYCLDCLILLLNNNNNSSYLLDDFEINVTFLNSNTYETDKIRDLLKKNNNFISIFKHQLHINKDVVSKSKLYYLLNNIYGGIEMNQLFNLNHIDLLNHFIDLCSIESEFVICFILNCINELLLYLLNDTNTKTIDQFKWNHYHDLISCLYYNGLPSVPYKTRRTVAEILVRHPQLYTSTSIQDLDLSLIWITIQLLGNDFEESIRDTITRIITCNSVVFETIRDELFNKAWQILLTKSINVCAVYLLSWITRCSTIDTNDTDNAANDDNDEEITVFNKGDMNLYMEDIHITKLSISTLKNVIFNQLTDKTPTQYIVELLTNQQMISWFPNESKAASIILLDSLKNKTVQTKENQLNLDIFKTNLLQYKINLLLQIIN